MSKINTNILFYRKWDEETAKAWLAKIFAIYDTNKDGKLERAEVNDWRSKTTHPKNYVPFSSDKEWQEYVKVNYNIDLTDGKITLDQLFEIQKAQDAKAQYLGGNTLFTDIWHMLDQGLISDDSLVPHVVLKSQCSRCLEFKKLIDFRGVSADVRGQGGQWLKPDLERVCIDCENDQNLRTTTRAFEINGVQFLYKFTWLPTPPGVIETDKKETTRLIVDGEEIGRIEYQEEGRNYIAKTFFKNKPVKSVVFFALDDSVPRQKFVEDTAKAEAKKYFEELAAKTKLPSKDLALTLSELFLFPNPYQVSDIFALE